MPAGQPQNSRASTACTSTRCTNWRSKYGGLDVSELVRLKELEAENGRMERIIARQALEIHAMSEVIRKNEWGPQRGGKR